MSFAELLARYKAGEIDLDEFAAQCASNWVYAKPLGDPETDGNELLGFGPSSVTVENARYLRELTKDETEAIYAALPADPPAQS